MGSTRKRGRDALLRAGLAVAVAALLGIAGGTVFADETTGTSDPGAPISQPEVVGSDPAPAADPAPEPTGEPQPAVEPVSEPAPEPVPDPDPAPEPDPGVEPEPTPGPTPDDPAPEPGPGTDPGTDPTTEPDPSTDPTTEPEPGSEPGTDPATEPAVDPEPTPDPDPATPTDPEAQPAPTGEPTPADGPTTPTDPAAGGGTTPDQQSGEAPAPQDGQPQQGGAGGDKPADAPAPDPAAGEAAATGQPAQTVPAAPRISAVKAKVTADCTAIEVEAELADLAKDVAYAVDVRVVDHATGKVVSGADGKPISRTLKVSGVVSTTAKAQVALPPGTDVEQKVAIEVALRVGDETVALVPAAEGPQFLVLAVARGDENDPNDDAEAKAEDSDFLPASSFAGSPAAEAEGNLFAQLGYGARVYAPSSTNGWFYSGVNPYYNDYLAPTGHPVGSAYTIGNCTWYAWGRAAEILGHAPDIHGALAPLDMLAQVQATGAYRTGTEPRVGALVVGKANHWHVAVVEAIVDGVVYVSESGYATSSSWCGYDGIWFHYGPLQAWMKGVVGYIYLVDDPADIAVTSFSDAPSDAWFAKPGWLDFVVRRGLMTGTVDGRGNETGRFEPDRPLTLAEAEVLAYRAAHQGTASRAVFDVNELLAAHAWCVEAGLVRVADDDAAAEQGAQPHDATEKVDGAASQPTEDDAERDADRAAGAEGAAGADGAAEAEGAGGAAQAAEAESAGGAAGADGAGDSAEAAEDANAAVAAYLTTRPVTCSEFIAMMDKLAVYLTGSDGAFSVMQNLAIAPVDPDPAPAPEPTDAAAANKDDAGSRGNVDDGQADAADQKGGADDSQTDVAATPSIDKTAYTRDVLRLDRDITRAQASMVAAIALERLL